MTYLLCTLTGQHIPNLLSVHHFKPDIHFLLATPEMISKTEYFLSALKLGGKDYSEHKSKIIKLNHAEDVDQLNLKMEELVTEYKDGNWIINLTGGTKWLNIALFDFFKSSRRIARFIYSPNKYPTHFLEWDSGKENISDYEISVEEFLLGYGYKIPRSKTFQNFDNELELSIQIAKCCPGADLLYIEENRRKKGRNKGLKLLPGDDNIPSKIIRTSIKDLYGLVENQDGHLDGKLSKEAFKFLTGGWLEVFFAGLINFHSKSLGIRDVQFNIAPSSDKVENELDVAFMHENTLYQVECKSGDQSHDPETDILYKIMAVSQQYKAIGIKSILATTSLSIMDEGKVKEKLRERAEEYKCHILTKKDIQAIAEHADDYTVLKDALFPPKKPNTLS
jgi:hypothetical protein